MVGGRNFFAILYFRKLSHEISEIVWAFFNLEVTEPCKVTERMLLIIDVCINFNMIDFRGWYWELSLTLNWITSWMHLSHSKTKLIGYTYNQDIYNLDTG